MNILEAVTCSPWFCNRKRLQQSPASTEVRLSGHESWSIRNQLNSVRCMSTKNPTKRNERGSGPARAQVAGAWAVGALVPGGLCARGVEVGWRWRRQRGLGCYQPDTGYQAAKRVCVCVRLCGRRVARRPTSRSASPQALPAPPRTSARTQKNT